MPPKKKQKKQAAATGGGGRGGRRGGGRAARPPAVSPLEALPDDVQAIIAEHLLTQDELNSPVSAAATIASLACTSKKLRALAEGLWPALGELYPSAPPPRRGALATVTKDERWEAACPPNLKTRKLCEYPPPKQVAADYEEEVPDEVPEHIYSEVRRLRCLATAGTNDKAQWLLSDADLRALPPHGQRGSLGTAHLYSLTDLLDAAREKHGTPDGVAAAAAAKERAAQEAKQKRQAKAAERRQKVAAELGEAGVAFSDAMAADSRVAAYIRRSKGAPSKAALLPYCRLLAWCDEHTDLGGIFFRDENEGYNYYGTNYYSKAEKAAASVSEEEEADLIRLACQGWAGGHGGPAAALASPGAPPAGSAVRAAVERALRERLQTSVAWDLHCMPEFEEERAWEEAGYEAGYVAQRLERGEGDDEEGGEGGDGAGPSGADAQRAVAAFLRYPFEAFVQVDLAAPSAEALGRQERWVRCYLEAVACGVSDHGGRVHEACARAFRPPPAGEGGEQGQHRACFFIGVQSKLAPRPFSGAAPAAGAEEDEEAEEEAEEETEEEAEEGAAGGAGGPLHASAAMASKQKALTDRAQRWPHWAAGMALSLTALQQLPDWVAGQAGEAAS